MKDEYLYLWAQWGILGFSAYQDVLEKFGDLQEAWKGIRPGFFAERGMGREKVERMFAIREQLSFPQILAQAERAQARLICIEDSDYPEPLRQMENPPPFLWVRGRLPSFHKSIAVVGTRAMSAYGQYASQKFTRQLVQNGFVIVSGLALGVDACAHQVTLDEKGITVAVLGSGVDQVYPAGNQRLASRILQQGGALVSAYPLGTPAMKHHFPERNEIVAALARGVLVVEGGIRSGALITARLALDMGREVFAVPSGIDKTALSGANHLIRKSEAKLVESLEHILEEFQMQASPPALALEFGGDEKKLLDLLAQGSRSIDQLAQVTGWPITALSQLLTQLHLSGAVRQNGPWWSIG